MSLDTLIVISNEINVFHFLFVYELIWKELKILSADLFFAIQNV